jgi:hypothetical protein
MHRVNRIEIELHSGEPALARALSERVSRIHRERIAPVLDRVCSELSGGEAVDRIARLELDLGTVAADDLEDAFVARLEPALRAALANALRRTAGDHPVRASLELLETFALTGSLPWWAPTDREVVARHFARATVEAEADLVALLGRLAQDPGALDRIARLCDRNVFAALAQSSGDEAASRPPSTSSRVTPDTSRRRQPPDPAGLDPRPSPPRGAATADPAPSDLPLVDPALQQTPSAAPRLTGDASRRRQLADPAGLDPRHSPPRGAATSDTSSDLPPVDPELQQLPSAAPPLTGDASRRQQAALDPRPSPARGAATGDTPSDLPPDHQAVEQTPAATSRFPDDAARRRRFAAPTPLERRPPVPPVVPAASATPSPMTADPPRLPPAPAAPAAIRAARRGALARLDELYVADAGLVILWPFLERFFVRTGVLGDDRRFFDEVAQLQAVALVESLATADPAPLEFQLPLAKLLCGRPFESDFVLERPLTAEQLAEADHLLAAVIDRAPVAGELSIASFRAGFLVRPGALGTRDGAWLLQVERRPHDAVLDRFPWSWGWIKLPWMPEPLRVEW